MPDRAMNLRDAVDLLQATPLFANIEPSKLKLLAYASDEARFCTGDTLFVQGGASDVAYVIAEGEVEVTWEARMGPRSLPASANMKWSVRLPCWPACRA